MHNFHFSTIDKNIIKNFTEKEYVLNDAYVQLEYLSILVQPGSEPLCRQLGSEPLLQASLITATAGSCAAN